MAEEPIPADFEDVDDIVEALERDPARRAGLARARARIAARLEAGKTSYVALLRMKRGWSQRQLAEQIQTSQSHIARIEAGTEDLHLSTMRKLAAALGVPLRDLVEKLAADTAKP